MASLDSIVGKIVIIGDSTVGKTALLKTYLTSGFEYSEKYTMTMGVLPSVTGIRIPDYNDSVKFLFYDTTGSDLYNGILHKYWEAPDIALIVYDVSSPTSFSNVNRWLELIKSIKWSSDKSESPVAIAIFANKTDLFERRLTNTETGKKFADQLRVSYFEGSAKTNEGIKEMFQWFAYKWLEKRPMHTN